MAFTGGLSSISASPQNITTLRSLPMIRHYVQLSVKASQSNAGNVFVGDSTVSSTSYAALLTPGSSYTFGPFGGTRIVNSSEVYIVGTSGDKVQLVEIF